MKTLTIASEGYAVQQSLDSNPRLHIEKSTLEYLFSQEQHF